MRIIRTITKIVGNAHETTIIVVQLQNVAVCVKARIKKWSIVPGPIHQNNSLLS